MFSPHALDHPSVGAACTTQHNLTDHVGRLDVLRVAPDGSWLAIGTGWEVEIWDVATGTTPSLPALGSRRVDFDRPQQAIEHPNPSF